LPDLKKFRRETPVLTAIQYLTNDIVSQYNSAAKAFPDKWKGVGLVRHNFAKYAGMSREDLKKAKQAKADEYWEVAQSKWLKNSS